MMSTDRIESNAPTFPEIWDGIFSQARGAELQSMPLPFTVIHFEYEDPMQRTGQSELPVQQTFVGSQSRIQYCFEGRACSATKLLQ